MDTLEKQTNNRAELKAAISLVVKVARKTVIFAFIAQDPLAGGGPGPSDCMLH